MTQGPWKLPKGWQWVKLGEVAYVIMGQSPPSASYNEEGEGLPFYQGKADFGPLYPTPRKWCIQPKKIAQRGDVLISVRAPVGPTNVCPDKSCIGRGLAALRPKERLDNLYLLYWLRYLEASLATMGQGSTFGAISKGDVEQIHLPLSPLSEQRRIVAYLEGIQAKAEELRRLQQETQKELDALVPAVLDRAFRGKL